MARVLLIEDDYGIAQLINLLLEDQGHSVLHASSLEDGVKRVEGGSFDLIVSDLAPGVSSEAKWHSLQTLRRAAFPIPIVVCTADTSAVRASAELQGVSAIIPKPFDPDLFVQSVEDVLS